MKSAKTVFEVLKDAGIVSEWTRKRNKLQYTCDSKPLWYTEFFVKGETLRGTSDETYGKKSELYFSFTDEGSAHEARKVLRGAGVKVESWNNGSSFSVPVSFFKGWHWWE
jgi:hypothetical protein